MPCVELFDAQTAEYRAQVLGEGVPRVSIEAGVTYGWAQIVGENGASIGIDRYGASAPGKVVAEKLGLNVENIIQTVKKLI